MARRKSELYGKVPQPRVIDIRAMTSSLRRCIVRVNGAQLSSASYQACCAAARWYASPRVEQLPASLVSCCCISEWSLACGGRGALGGMSGAAAPTCQSEDEVRIEQNR